MRYNSLNQYLRNRFGCKVYKIAINGGFTCPNRDGKIDNRGCIFCSGYGSGDFAEDASFSVSEQIERGKIKVAGKMPKRYGGKEKSGTGIPAAGGKEKLETGMLAAGSKEKSKTGITEAEGKENPDAGTAATDARNDLVIEKRQSGKYIAYFQAFTNTYAPVERLRQLYMEAINHEDVVVLSIATRPDCLPEEVLGLLAEINEIKPVWVELGLQTIHESSAKYIRRGYALEVYDRAVRELRKRNIEVITHVILGLPGETREDMLESVRYVGESGVQGIKLQLLHVIKGTDLAKDYENGLFECMTLDEYTDLIRDCIAVLPENIVIHRMTGDGDKKTLIAPLWSADKKRVLNELNRKIFPFIN